MSVGAEDEVECSASDERRKTSRFPCGGTGEVIVLGGALRFTGELLDLSAEAGCRLATEVMFTLERELGWKWRW